MRHGLRWQRPERARRRGPRRVVTRGGPRGQRHARWPLPWWREAGRFTVADCGREGVLLAAVEDLGNRMVVTDRLRLAAVGGDPTAALADLRGIWRRRLAMQPLWLTVPRAQLSVRYLELPSQAPDELDAMVKHQLPLTLPVAPEALAWTWRILEATPQGGSRVMVSLLRRDRLRQILQPWTDAGARNVRGVPEGDVLALSLAARFAPGPGARRAALLVRSNRADVLVYDAHGACFHHAFSRTSDPGASTPSEPGLVEIVAEARVARQEYARLLGSAMPEPLELRAWGDSPDTEDLQRLAKVLSRHETIAVRAGDPVRTSPDTAATEAVPAPVATLARCAQRARGALTLESAAAQQRSSWKRAIRETIVGLALLGALATGLAGLELRRDRARLAALEHRLAAQSMDGSQLEAMRRAIDQQRRWEAQALRPLYVLESLDRYTPQAVRLQQVHYAQGEGVTVQGEAPNVEAVTALADSLQRTALWQRIEVDGVHRRGGAATGFEFTLRGSLAPHREAGP